MPVRTVSKKFLLILALPVLAAGGVLWAFWAYSLHTSPGVAFANAAGRQRMLSERLHHYAHMVHSGQDEDREALRRLVLRFDSSLDTLLRGGSIPDLNLTLPPPPDAVVPYLGRVQHLWAPLREDLLHIYGLPRSDPEMERAWVAVHKGLPELTRAANAVVEAYEAYDRSLNARMRHLLVFNVLFTLLLCVGGFWAARRFITRPILQLKDATEAFEHGDFTRRVEVRTYDEIASLAAAYNAMADTIQRELQIERELRRRQQSLAEAVIGLARQTASEEALRHVGELARRMTGVRWCMMSYRDGEGRKQFIPLGMSEEEAAAIAHPPESKGLLGLLWEQGRIVRTDNIPGHAAAAGMPDGHPPMRHFLGVPIKFGDEILGALYLTDPRDGGAFDEEDEEVVRILAAATAVALANARNIEALREANATLEQRVKERTRELVLANTRLRNREVELELLNEELSRANEAKNQFLANTSHELRTPLNAIIGFSELLENPRLGSLNEKQRRYVRHVHESGKRLLKIINDLLDISKIEAGMMSIDEVPCIPGLIAERVVDELQPLADGKKLQLSMHKGAGADREILTDAGKLQQMLVNLIGNAIKFTPERGHVDVSIDVQAEGKDLRIVASVADDGIGISKEDQERIFEPFVQAMGGLGREHGGTGLGLALTRKQILMLGGNLHLESAEGKGSTFTFEIPVQGAVAGEEEAKPEEPEVAPAPPPEEAVPEHGPIPLVLLVDEDEGRRKAVARMIKEEGYRMEFSDFAHVAEAAIQNVPFLIMLGIPAGEREIHARLKRLRLEEATRNLPVILVGGTAAEPEFSMGTVEMMEKGVRRQELFDMVSRYGRHLPNRINIPTILVVDDDASVREFLKETLVSEGYHVILAAGGEDGVRLAIEQEPDMIILDLMMPGVTGFDVIRRLRQHPGTSDIPIVIYTAKDLSREESLKLGREVERVLLKGAAGRAEILRQLQKLELLYPVQAHLVDAQLDCFNSRYLVRRLKQECENAKRYSQRFSVVGWEMDGYEDYIRTHGERWGIAALKGVVDMTKSVTRRGDICARVDVSRFALLLPSISPAGALRAAEKLRIRIRHMRFPLPDDRLGTFTASFGVVHFGDDAEEPKLLMEALARRIDRARGGGGDRCIQGEI